MLSSVIPFRKKVNAVGWRPDELAECYRVVGLLARSGLPVSIDSGMTDEGEPWAIVLREDTGDVLLHMARLDGSFVVVSAAGPVAQRGESLRAVLDTAVRTGGLAMLTRRSAAADSEILRLHPATLIAAFIAGAWVHTETSQAEMLQASARREDGSISRTDDARPTGFATPPPAAVLATAAASFVAVAAALDAAQADPVLEMTAEDFIQAALELLVTTNPEALAHAAPVNFMPVEFANLDLQQDAPDAASAMMGEPAAEKAPPGNADPNQRFETVAASTPDDMSGAVDILHFSVQQPNSATFSGLAWDADIRHVLAVDLRQTKEFTAEFSPEGEPEPLTATVSLPVEDAASAGRAMGEILAPVRTFLAATAPPVRVGEDAAVSRAKISVAVDDPGLRLAHSTDALNLIFKSAMKILNLDRNVTSVDPDAAMTSDKNGSSILSSAMMHQTSDAATKTTDDALLGKTTSAVSSSSGAQVFSFSQTVASGPELGKTTPVVSSNSGIQASSFSQTAPSGSEMDKSAKPFVAVVQPPPPPSNAQLLLEFTTGTEHVVRVDRAGLGNPLSGLLNTGDARKVVVFDAPWLEVKSFMLMPGVMMMEDDLLGGVNRAGMEMKGSPVSLDLGGGLTLTLLGVVELGLT